MVPPVLNTYMNSRFFIAAKGPLLNWSFDRQAPTRLLEARWREPAGVVPEQPANMKSITSSDAGVAGCNRGMVMGPLGLRERRAEITVVA